MSRIFKAGSTGTKPDFTKAKEAEFSELAIQVKHELEPDDEPKIKGFPLHCLPVAARQMARAICSSGGVPEALAGSCVLAAISCSIGAGLRVTSGANRTTGGNLYIMPDGESGSGKSVAFSHALAPFIQFAAERKAHWKENLKPGLETEKETLEDDIRSLRGARAKSTDAAERAGHREQIEALKVQLADVESRLHPPKYFTQDSTSQVLAPLLSRAPGECMASLSADARELVDIWNGKYTKGGTDENFYVQAWTGDVYESDRIGREGVSLQSPCLASLWLVQGDKLEALFAQRSLLEGGFLARILVCHTLCRPQKITREPEPIPEAVALAYSQLIHELLETYREALEGRVIDSSPEALGLFNAHYNGIVERWESGELRDVASFSARWTEQAWRLAACLHAGQHGGQAHAHPLSEETARRAIELAEWFSAQQLEILSVGRAAGKRKIREAILALLVDKPTGIRASDVYRARLARDAEHAHELLSAMESEGLLAGTNLKPEGGGHITRLFTRPRK